MSRLSDLCRLCLVNCRLFDSSRTEKSVQQERIRDCLSIIIQDDLRYPLIICIECDNKLESFSRFRQSSVRAQDEFAEIIKTVHFEYYPHESTEYYSHTQGYNHCSYIDLEPAPDCKLDYLFETATRQISPEEERQPQISDNAICFSEGTEGHYESFLSVKDSQHDEPKIEQYIEPEYEQLVVEQYVEEPAAVASDFPAENLPEDDHDSFTYDDFDDNTCQSTPSDRNNVDNAIDQKIEEFIQNKGGKKTNPKICSICSKLFRTNYKLRIHYETHAENNAKFVCDFAGCSKAFKSKIGLKEHNSRHTGAFNFKCETCEKKFLLKSYFLAHLRIHDKKRPSFPCSLCPKTFKSKQNLTDHANKHLGIKFFKCDICSKSFTTKTHLDHHVRAHNQSEQFLCTICNKFLKSKNYLKIHIKTHFPELKNYKCGYCAKTFIQMSDLKIHSLTHTKDIKEFLCDTCGKSFSRNDSLQLHLQIHRKDKRYSCECGKTYSRQNSLNCHKKRCVQPTVN